jgi:hypothetical protein
MATRRKTSAAPRTRLGWVRTHFDNALVAEVRWLGHQYEITLSRPKEARVVHRDCCREVGILARREADRLVDAMYPHSCDKAECAPWVRVGRPPTL